MKYSIGQLMRKIRGRERAIEQTKTIARHSMYVIKENMKKPGVIGGIVGALALVTGATIGLVLRKKKVTATGSKKKMRRVAHHHAR